jgi:hypothetical protein
MRKFAAIILVTSASLLSACGGCGGVSEKSGGTTSGA